MRNLKKILALVLALVMSLSLMSVAGATEFPDSDQISETYAESVDVLTGLKVFQGNKGEFKPKDNITRAEVANIIYRIVTGDVDGTSVGIYADYNKFTDVPNTAWFAGCVNYCANAEYIKGRGNGKFDPYGNVTGYEALAMILRAIGYDKNGEFTGANWQIQTAATARNRGITKNIVEGTLGVAASREMVAEILCQTILVPVADYSLAFGYRTTDAVTGKENETLAKKTFGMERLEGVVTANEYASLTATSPLPAGQTTIGDKTLNVTSTLDDLGESRYVYVRPAAGTTRSDLVSSKVYDTGDNNVYDSGAAVKTVDKDTGKDNGITSIAGAQHFINYDEITEYTTNMRLSYVIFTRLSQYDAYTMLVRNGGRLYTSDAAGTKGAEITGITAAGQPNWSTVIPSDSGYWLYEKDINAFTKLDVNGYDYNNMRDIFIRADLSDNNNITRLDRGEVYEGTTSVGNNGGRPADLSDSINWDTFVAKYLVGDNNKKQISSNGLGDRLKIVDNNNDGVAEYVLQTIYTLGMVSSVASDGKITLDITNADFDRDVDNGVTCHSAPGAHWVAPNDHRVDTVNHVTTQKVINDGEAELAAGNAVIYAVIDGNVRVQLAETVAATVNTVNRATRVATTSDGDELSESAVHEHSTALTHGVANLVGGTTYTLYKDLYGNLAAFTEGANGEFVLITDGWFDNRKAGAEYAVRAFIDGSIQTVDITSGGSLFIGSGTAQNNAWGQLREIPALNNEGHNVTTMVANLQNGVLTPVDKMYLYSRTVRMLEMKDNVIPRRDNQTTSKGIAYDTEYRSGNPYAYNVNPALGLGVGNADGTYDVRALSTTTYYYVYNYLNRWNGTEPINTVVRSYTGYANAPAVDAKDVEDVYVVGTKATNASGNTYFTADVVVVELNNDYRKSDSEQVFIPAFTVANNNLHYEDVELIRGNGVKETVTIDLWKSTIRAYDPVRGIDNGGLYYMDESDTEKGVYIVLPMSSDDISYGRYAVGYIDKDYATSNDDWDSIELYTFDTNNLARAAEDPIKDTDVVETAKRNVESSKYYTLGYNTDRSPIFNESTRQIVMNQNPDGSHVNDTTAGWINETQTPPNVQKNEVLVAYNSANQIVYAISFRDYISNSSNDHDVWAQQMWRNNMPNTYKHETPVEDTAVSFYGVPATLNGTEFTAEVNWSAATPDGNNIVVSNGTIVAANSATSADKKSAATVRTTGEKVYTGVIMGADGVGYTYSLTQKAQHTLHTLRSKNNTIATIAGNVITTAAGGQKMAISQFMANFVTGADADGCGTCEIRNWKFYNASGIQLDTATNTMQDVDSFTVEVYNPDTGDTQVYYQNGTHTPVTTRTITAKWTKDQSPNIELYWDSALTRAINPDFSREISPAVGTDSWIAQWTVPDKTTVYAATKRAYAGDFGINASVIETTQSDEADEGAYKVYTNKATIKVDGANVGDLRFQMRPLPKTEVNLGLVNEDTTNITAIAMPTGYTDDNAGDAWYTATAVPVGEDGSEAITFVLTVSPGYIPKFNAGTAADYGTITPGSAANTWNVTLVGATQDSVATLGTTTIGSLLLVVGTPVDATTPASLKATVVKSKEILNATDDVTGITGVTINGWGATAAQAEAGNKSAQLPEVDPTANDLFVNFTYNANHINYTGTVQIAVTRNAT